MAAAGECWTLNTAEWTDFLAPCHSNAAVCSLSDILVTGEVPPEYFLTPRACRGILRRAAKRRRVLPDLLQRALMAVADTGTTPTPPIKT